MAKKGLGNGLDSLFSEKPVLEQQAAGERVAMLPIEEVKANPNQPRQFFDKEKHKELVASIKEQGVLQPILVRPFGENGYQIIAGERRYRASVEAGLKDVPAIVRDLDDTVTLEVALIENIQRQNLNPLEEAISYRELMDKYDYTQAKLGEKLGKTRVYIANTVRLLGLPQPIQEAIVAGQLSGGHGKALLQVAREKDRLALAEKAILEGLSVRQIEECAKNPELIYQKPAGVKPKAVAKEPAKPRKATIEELVLDSAVEKLRSKLGTKVSLQQTGKSQGKIILEYYGSEDLDRILQVLLPGEEF